MPTFLYQFYITSNVLGTYIRFSNLYVCNLNVLKLQIKTTVLNKVSK